MSDTPKTYRPPDDSELRPGARPVPEYTLVDRLGRGQFGEVWRARDDNGLEVALKFVRHDPSAGGDEVAELEAMKNAGHPHLLVLHRYWQLDGRLVLALELARGSLDDLRKAEPNGAAACKLLEYFREAAKGLDYLHSLGMQHRDVKPANLLLVGGGVKVADFGLAKLLSSTLATNTGGRIAGTPAFAAPEVWQSKTSRHSDQYALAASWYQLRVGRPPFRGDDLMALAFAHCQSEPDLSMLSEAERPAVARALAKQPGQRWPSCREFVEALAGAAAATTPDSASPTLLTTAMPSPRRKRRPALAAFLLLGLLAGASIAAFFAGRTPYPPATTGGAVAIESEKDKQAAVTRPRPAALDCTGAAGVDAGEIRRAQQEWAAYLGRKVEETVEIADGVAMTFVLVPPGRFRMGSPETEADRADDEVPHEVTLTEPFDLGRYEVTQRQYRALVAPVRYGDLTNDDPSQFKGAERPVERVSWQEADGIARAWTRFRADGHTYRLPTEAEWEYACRAGRPSDQPFGVGDGRSLSVREANFNGEFPYGAGGRGPSREETREVAAYGPNPLGLWDMHGNVWEWCADQFGSYTPGAATNPTGPEDGPQRVTRGGGWQSHGMYCRAATRRGQDAGHRDFTLGFRMARTIPAGTRSPSAGGTP